MEYEVIIGNKYFKTIRLTYGVIINIFKYKLGEDISWHIENNRRDLRKISDKLYETKTIITNKYTKREYPVGTKLYKFNSCNYYLIDKKLEKEDWKWELKTTGDYFSGDTIEFKRIIELINKIIEDEREM